MNGFPRHWHLADLERRLTVALDIALRALEVLVPEGYADEADPAADVPATPGIPPSPVGRPFGEPGAGRAAQPAQSSESVTLAPC